MRFVQHIPIGWTSIGCPATFKAFTLNPKCLPERESSFVPEDDTQLRDEEYARRYWDRFRNRPKPWSEAHIEDLRQTMRESLVQAAETTGIFPELVGKDRITDEWKEQLSAYRQLAREMGYEMGPFRFNERTNMVVAEIRKRK